ncbi:MAG: adenosylcobinamide-GDP ribazoletransferase [Peptococcaceae bacterium]|jgi:adenosylcobinamide-GDP ribazoletransferase|nr:adenosylcobinamide-GDP ribazoletransferase [Peptococcaceae bacterium]
MRGFWLACQFLTIVPVTVRGPVEDRDLAAAMAWFPLVGLLLGAAAAGVYVLTAYVSPSALSAFVPLAFLVLVTGNMHGDALMDAADGLGSGRPPERALEIMKDSHVGAHGVMAGVLGFLAKLLLLGALHPAGRITALVLVPALGRWTHVYAARTNPYVRPDNGKGGFTRYVGNRELILASGTLVAAALVLMGPAGAVPVAAALVVAHLAGRHARKMLGGLTGDIYGALGELVEMAGLAVILLLERF